MGKTTTSFPCIPHQNLGAVCYVEAVESKEIVTCGRLYIFGWCRVNCRLQIRKVIYGLHAISPYIQKFRQARAY